MEQSYQIQPGLPGQWNFTWKQSSIAFITLVFWVFLLLAVNLILPDRDTKYIFMKLNQPIFWCMGPCSFLPYHKTLFLPQLLKPLLCHLCALVLLSTSDIERIRFFNLKRWSKPSSQLINNVIVEVEGMLLTQRQGLNYLNSESSADSASDIVFNKSCSK